MKAYLSRAMLFAATACLFLSFCRAQISIVKPIPSKATITVDAGKSAGAPIPRTIFGSFLEPIGNSTYNGLWAELLANPSLEENLWSASTVTGHVCCADTNGARPHGSCHARTRACR